MSNCGFLLNQVKMAKNIKKSLEKLKDEILSSEYSGKLDYHARIIDKNHIDRYFVESIYRFIDIIQLCLLLLPSKGKILDIGIAHGFYSIVLKKQYGFEVYGTELEENIPVYCDFPISQGVDIIPYNILEQRLPFDSGTFDIIILSEVVEHLRFSPLIAFKEARRVLKKGGFLIVTTPHFARLANILKLLVGINITEKFPNNLSTNVSMDTRAHVREYTVRELKELFSQADLAVHKIKMSRCLDRYNRELIRGKSLLHHCFYIARSIITRIFPFYRGDIIICARKN